MRAGVQLIGRVVGLYCEGRRDAAAGRPRARSSTCGDWRYYAQGFDDETERMAAERRLAQLELELTA